MHKGFFSIFYFTSSAIGDFFATSNYRLSHAAVSFSEDFRAVIDHRQNLSGVRSHVSPEV